MGILRTFEEDGKTLALRTRTSREAGGRTAYDLVLGNVVLLSSAALETERAFGELAAGAKNVVIGGLGFGATLRGVLAVAAPDARVVVVEKLATVETLLRGDLADLAAGALDDPRVTVARADVADVIASAACTTSTRSLDALLLDVDNGPDWASFRGNARLYGAHGLAQAYAALAPGGLYAVWSGYAADGFLPRLRAAGFAPKAVPLRERGVVQARAYCGTRPRETP